MAKTTTRVLAASFSLLGTLACRGSGGTAQGGGGYCQLDYHCPAGSYCSAGVCDSDCTLDNDCPSGQGCDPRGRCVSPGRVAPPPRFAGRLNANRTRLELSPRSPQGSLTLRNDGREAIERYHVLTDDPGVEVSPSEGTLPAGASVPIQVTVHSLNGHGTMLHVLSTGGKVDLPLAYYDSFAGRMEGSVTVQAPFWLGAAPFAIELSETGGAADGGVGLRGAVDGKASLLWPVNAPVEATDDGKNFFASFQMVGQPGDPVDPLFDVPVRRTIVLQGQHDPTFLLSVSGTYTEAVEWFQDVTLHVTGTFQLRRQGGVTGVTPRPAPPFQLSAGKALAGCADPKFGNTDGDSYFSDAFAFESLGDVDGYDNGMCQISTGDLPCVSPKDATCAFAAFSRDDREGGGALDVARAAATYGLLSGNDDIAKALMPVTAPGEAIGLDGEIGYLSRALTRLTQGLHGGERAPIALFISGVAASLWGSPAFSKLSSRDDVVNRRLDDVHRFGGAVAARIFAGEEELDRKARQGDGDVAFTAQALAGGALLDLGALGALLSSNDVASTLQALVGSAFPDLGVLGALLSSNEAMSSAAQQGTGGGGDGETVAGETNTMIPSLGSSFGALAGTFSNAVHGMNALGYSDSYVPFGYNPSNPEEDIYKQACESAGNATAVGTLMATAFSDEAGLKSSVAATVSATGDMHSALIALEEKELDQIIALGGEHCTPQCSSTALNDCCASGILGRDVDAMKAAQDAYTESTTRLNNDGQELAMLQQQLDALYSAQQKDLFAILTTGQQADLTTAKNSWSQLAGDGAACLEAVMGGSASVSAAGPSISGGSGLAGCSSIITALVSSSAQNQELLAEDQAQEAYTLQVGQNLVQDQAVERAIVDVLADAQEAINVNGQQGELFAAAEAQIANDQEQLSQVSNDYQEQLSVDEQPMAEKDLTFRLYRDAAAFQWAQDMRAARRAVFGVVRAYEYLAAENLGGPREAEVLAAETAEDLQAILDDVATDYDAARFGNEASWAQQREDEISLAHDILGIHGEITDPVTGQSLSEAQQFQRLLALPRNRDAQGNVALPFSTSILPGNGVFATDVAVDVITGLQASLVGSAISGRTAYVTLLQSGRGRLRATDGSIQTYALGSKTASVPAGINFDPVDDPLPLPSNSDLYSRPVDDASWTLIFDQQAEPTNAAVDVSQLTDIEFWIQHQTQTIQR